MHHLRIHIHVSEPYSFERENGGESDLDGWSVDHLEDGCDEWIVHLDRPFTMDKEVFEAVRISPRYFREHLARIGDRLVSVPANIVPHGRRWRDMDSRPLVMVGIVAQGGPAAPIE
jgi:hypothetical protein